MHNPGAFVINNAEILLFGGESNDLKLDNIYLLNISKKQINYIGNLCFPASFENQSVWSNEEI